jgi:5-aminolevulinate synthase
MGPALAMRSPQLAQAAGYASIAGQAEVDAIHKKKGIYPVPDATGANVCPHALAAAARAASEAAMTLAREKTNPVTGTCPVPHQVDTATSPKVSNPTHFNYAAFYNNELEKKHKDKSYRYFNNINRLANKFPVAHTSSVEEEVTVWCSNDYLGMGKNPVVLDTMQ